MNQLLSDRYYVATVERMKAEIRKDIQTGKLPGNLTSFESLHNHVDANCYGGLCEESDLDGFKGIDALCFHYPNEPHEEAGSMGQRAIAAVNDMQGDVGTWLANTRGEDGGPTYFTKPHNPTGEYTPEGFPIYADHPTRRGVYVPALGGLGWFGEEMSKWCARELIQRHAGKLLEKLVDCTNALDGFKAAWDENRLLTSDEAKALRDAHAVADALIARVEGRAL